MLVIVRDEAALHYVMANADIAPPGATIVLDRRTTDRRRGDADGTLERRGADRRRRAALHEVLERDGFAIVDSSHDRIDTDDARA